MRVLDLFSGLKGWSEPFIEHGHDVITLDNEPEFKPDYCMDILDFNPEVLPAWWYPDVILASPPCQGFSVMNIGQNWTGPHDFPPHHPKTPRAILALDLVAKTIDIIDKLRPRFFIIENPRAKLRVLPIMSRFERRTVTYCQYGEKRMKPTDLWSDKWPPTLTLRPPCKNGASCHIRAPRGSTTGTQGMSSADAAKIPYQLADEVRIAIEAAL